MAIIREARAADADAIAAVHVETWHNTYAGIIPDRVLLGLSARREAGYWQHALRRPAGRFLVMAAENAAGAVVGYASGGSTRSGELPYDGEVYTLYVLPDYQGCGIGRQLLSALFARMVAAGFGSAVIWVLAENPSRFFYQAMGGTWVAVRDERFCGVMLSEMAYGWSNLACAVAPSSPRAAG